jgi:hypothetical protein
MLFRIQEVLGSDLSSEAKYADVFHELPQCIQENAGKIQQKTVAFSIRPNSLFTITLLLLFSINSYFSIASFVNSY